MANDIFGGGFSQSFTEEDREEHIKKGEDEASEQDDEVEEIEENAEEQDGDAGEDSEEGGLDYSVEDEEEVEEEPEDEEEGEDDEGAEENEEEDDDEEESEPEEFEITYRAPDGTEQTATITEDELPEIYARANRDPDEEYVDFVEKVRPYVENINKSKLLQQIDYYLNKGYTDEDIMSGLAQRYKEEAGENPEEYEEFDMMDKKTFEQKVEEAVQKRLAPYENQIKAQQQQQQATEIAQHNDRTLVNALNKYGYDFQQLDENQKNAIMEAFKTYYGDEKGRVDVQNTRYQQHQLNGVVKAALVDKQFGKSEPKVRRKTAVKKKSKKIPKISSGAAKTKKANDRKELPKIDDVAIQQRKANWMNL